MSVRVSGPRGDTWGPEPGRTSRHTDIGKKGQQRSVGSPLNDRHGGVTPEPEWDCGVFG